MKQRGPFSVTYWGTMGSLARPLRPAEVTDKLADVIDRLRQRPQDLAKLTSLETIRDYLQAELPQELQATYGGNTTCIQIDTPAALLIVDGGSGIRELGEYLSQQGRGAQRPIHILQTHAHLDHTHALPFFDCLFDPRCDITLWATEQVHAALEAMLAPTNTREGAYLPLTYDMMPGLKRRRTVQPGETLTIEDITVRTQPLVHPGGCLGMRFETPSASFVVATDHEQKQAPDPLLVDFARDADLLYVDAQYLAVEYSGKQGIMGGPPLSREDWGHSTVETCVATAIAAGVKRLHLAHHDPRRDDADLARIERYAAEFLRCALEDAGLPPSTCSAELAYEGQIIKLG